MADNSEQDAASELRTERRQDQQIANDKPESGQAQPTDQSSTFQSANTAEPAIAGGKIDDSQEPDVRRQLDKDKRPPQSEKQPEGGETQDKSLRGQLRSARQAIRAIPQAGKAPATQGATGDAANTLATEAKRLAWQRAQGVVDGATFSIWFLTLFIGAASLGLFLARLLKGPKYDLRKEAKSLVVTIGAILLTALEWFIVVVLIAYFKICADNLALCVIST